MVGWWQQAAVTVAEVDAPPPWQRADRQQRLRGSATNAGLRELCHTAAIIANIPIVIHPGGEGSAAAPRRAEPPGRSGPRRRQVSPQEHSETEAGWKKTDCL